MWFSLWQCSFFGQQWLSIMMKMWSPMLCIFVVCYQMSFLGHNVVCDVRWQKVHPWCLVWSICCFEQCNYPRHDVNVPISLYLTDLITCYNHSIFFQTAKLIVNCTWHVCERPFTVNQEQKHDGMQLAMSGCHWIWKEERPSTAQICQNKQ